MNLKPHNTAITRSKPSKPARLVAKFLLYKDTTILDYGCGKGTDVAFYALHARIAHGYDPHPGFGRDQLASLFEVNGGYDVVTVTYVLNVVPTREERIQVLKSAIDRLAPGGRLVVSTRSPSEIEAEAKKKGWEKYNDGYITSKSRQTFQRGIDINELIALGRDAGLTFSDEYNVGSDTATAEFKKARK